MESQIARASGTFRSRETRPVLGLPSPMKDCEIYLAWPKERPNEHIQAEPIRFRSGHRRVVLSVPPSRAVVALHTS